MCHWQFWILWLQNMLFIHRNEVWWIITWKAHHERIRATSVAAQLQLPCQLLSLCWWVSSFQTLFLKNKCVCAALNRLQCVLLVISLRWECVKIFTWGRIEVIFSCTERMKGSGIGFSSPFSPDKKENSCVID